MSRCSANSERLNQNCAMASQCVCASIVVASREKARQCWARVRNSPGRSITHTKHSGLPLSRHDGVENVASSVCGGSAACKNQRGTWLLMRYGDNSHLCESTGGAIAV